MAPKRGGGSSIGDSSTSSGSSGSSSSGPLPELAELYPYALATVRGLLGTAIAYTILLLLLLFTIRNQNRWLTLPFLAAQILLIVRWTLVLSNTSVSAWFRLEYDATNLLLRFGLLLLFLRTFRQQQALRRTYTSAPPGGVFWVLHAVTRMALAAYALVTAAWVVLGFIVGGQAVNAFLDDSSWRLADFEYGVTMTSADVRDWTTLLNGGTRGAWQSFDVLWVEGLRKIQVRVGVAMPWLGVLIGLLLLGHSASLLGLAKGHVGPRPFGLVVAPLGLLLTSLLEGIVAVRWILWNTNILGDLGRWQVWASEVPTDLVVQMRTKAGEGWVPGYRTVWEGFTVAYAVLWMLGVVVALGAVGYGGGMRKKSETVVPVAVESKV